MDACTALAKAAATNGVEATVTYVPGDAPSVTIVGQSIEICADGTGKYDIWNIRPLNIIRPGLSLDQALAALMGMAA
jgi:hypothetical protein